MYKNLQEFREFIKNKKVAVLGLGISNFPLIGFLYSLGTKITAFDKQNLEEINDKIKSLEQYNINYSLGENYLSKLQNFDVIFRTPGMRFDIPELLKELDRGAHITSEMEVFFDICPSKIIAVTGSDGKTTTTSLIYSVLKENGYKCWLGGNIGNPLLDKIYEIADNDMVIVELSSFQLHTMKKSSHIAIVTNVTPNHLDIHKSMEEYINAKKNIFLFQNKEDLVQSKVVLNYDNEVTRSFGKEVISNCIYFSKNKSLEQGAYLKGNRLVYKDKNTEIDVLNVDDILIPGLHNIENFLATIAAIIDYVDPDVIKKVATTFKGVPHRIEFVREINGVKFYNDSVASSPARTTAGLKSFNQKVILIAGGYDKKIPYDSMGSILFEKVKNLILIGQTAEKIEKTLSAHGNKIPILKCESLEQAVNKAYEFASYGDIVLLSPASASFDMFKNFEERGEKFKELVFNL